MSHRRRLAGALLALVAVTSVAACGSDDAVTLSSASAAAAAPAPGAELSAADFAAAAKREGTTILDVRTPAEFAEGHLPGAVNIDVQSPDFAARIAQLDPKAPYAVYCRSGNRSAAALQLMQGAGFTSAYHLGGGIGAWQQAGGEVVTN
ncbi:rhodanese-like domain-containing protein [Intrasporangium sp. DVR]|uniref:rhodanese-like domain-containing protein n=1 Tax=Intrasporangium sp. DVR TaxID=3127867 RepID=UPI00313A5893